METNKFIEWFANEMKNNIKENTFFEECEEKHKNGEIITLPNGLKCIWIEPEK